MTEPFHVSTTIRARRDLQVPGVFLIYRFTNEADGQPYITYGTDAWPVGTTGHAIGELVQTLDLSGINISHFSASLVCTPLPVDLFTGGTPIAEQDTLNRDREAFWFAHHPQLFEPNIVGLIIGEAWAEDENGNAIALDVLALTPNVLDKGQVEVWMKDGSNHALTSRKVHIKAVVGYREYNAAGDRVVKTVGPPVVGDAHSLKRGQKISVSLTLTNGVTGPYSGIKSIIGAEPTPPTGAGGLANQLYDSLNILQHDGEHAVKETECTHLIGVGNTLNITGGLPEWENMNALVQAVSFDYTTGVTRITVGVAHHLNAGQFLSIFLFNRFRWTWRSPFEKNTGQPGQADSHDVGGDTVRENTVHAVETRREHNVLYEAVPTDWFKPEIQLKPEDITRVAAELDGLTPPAGVFPIIKATRMGVCVNGAEQVVVVLSTDPFSAAP